jgi:plastocyanin
VAFPVQLAFMPRAVSRFPALVCALAAGALSCATAAHAGTLEVRALQRDGKPLVGAVITAEAVSLTLPPAPPVKAIMDQVNLAFEPDVLVLPVKSSVQFPNSDAVRHQVYSFSSAHRFQLPLYRGKPYPPIVFEQAGVITLGCNIHDNMLAYIVVTDAPFFGRTDAAGSWTAPAVPDGRYRVRVWHPLSSESTDVEQEVQVGAERGVLQVRLAHGLKPAPLKGRPHSWEY